MVQGGGYRGSVAASFRVRLGRQSVWRRAVERTICAMPATRPSQLLTLQSFGDISRFLREGVADEESRQLRDSLGAMSTQIDEAVRTRRTSTDTTAIGRRVLSLSHCAREHQLFLTGLGSAWHALYEFGAYQRALRELRNAITDWQQMLERRSPKESASFDQFELLAWRTLGEALLLIDMYEHQSDPPSDLQDAAPPRKQSALQRVRAWFHRWRR